jgi:hypothetical protein
MAARAREAGAEVLVYGHSHVPAISRHAGALLFNPGALASGSFFTRQSPQTVGRLRVLVGDDGEHGGRQAPGATVEVEHLDLATGRVVDMPVPDPDQDFGVLGRRYQTWMIEPEMVSLVAELSGIQYENGRSVVQTVIPVYRRYFGRGLVSRQDMIDAVHESDQVSAGDREKWLAVLERR